MVVRILQSGIVDRWWTLVYARGRRRNEQRAVDSIDVNACSCSLHVLSNVPLHSRLVFFCPSFFVFFFFLPQPPFISPFRLFFFLFAVYSYCSFFCFNNGRLVVLLTRDIEVRRINTRPHVVIQQVRHFLIFIFPVLDLETTPVSPESRKLLSKLLQLLSVELVARCPFTMGSESGFCKWCNNEDNKRKQKWRVVLWNYE